MRKLIVNLPLGFDIPLEKQAEKVKEIGWDGVFTGWNEKEGNGAIADKIYSLGLVYQSVHAPFGDEDKLWLEGEAGDLEVEKKIACLREVKRIGVPIMVMHTMIGMENDQGTPTKLGVERFGKILREAEQLGVKIGVENMEGEIFTEALLRAYDSPNLGFTIDTGHEMCYNKRNDLIGKYASRIVSTHLNDNMGQTGSELTWFDDSHMLPFDGTADWQGIADRLNKANFKGELTFELVVKNRPERNTNDAYERMSFEEYASLALERARRFSAMIKE